ncbi:MAG: tetratricopeptide repeat-containing sensor histidine kinase [Spirosomataceae bacterium]|jgi:signal transduction histidine kinase/Tfp pilus assembly protein PilF
MKQRIVFLFIIISNISFAQKTQEAIKDLYLRVIEFDESKIDSLRIYANQIEKDSKSINYTEGECYGYRLRGIALELEGKYQEASKEYHSGLKISELKKDKAAKLMMISDLGALSISMKQYKKAKEYFLKSLEITKSQVPAPKPKRFSSIYSNLGICYKNLNQIDSALFYYSESLKIKRQIGDSAGIATLGINMSSLLVQQKKYSEAKELLDYNLDYHTRKQELDDLWHDNLNISIVYRLTNDIKKSKEHLDKGMELAKKLNSHSKIAETYLDYSRFYEQIGDFEAAYNNYSKYHELEKELINTETNSAIEELETKYETEKKTSENKLLTRELETQKQRNIFWTALSIMVALAAAAIGWALWQNRKKNKILTEKNDFIESQNKKLAELIQEKNNLISIVSHDLGSPFSGINLWSNILEKNGMLDIEAKEAVSNIQKMAKYGQKMVQQILNIEKDETRGRSLNLEKVNLVSTIKEIIADFGPAANGKGIQLEFKSGKGTVDYLTDKQYLTRILENLISNALKYSHRDGKVLINLESGIDEIKVKIKDFGVGMTREDQRNLFSKYGQTSSKPTENESSTGLGLHIVKRLLDELGGTITCQSELGKGSEFTVVLKK